MRIEMSSSYAVCCMLHAVCCMLYAVLYAVCCMLHAILKALGDARILPIFIKNPSKMGSKTDPKWGPGGFLGRPGALGRDHVGSGSIFHRFRAPFWEPFGAMLGSKTVKKSIWGDSKSPKRLNTLLDGFQHRLLIDFGPILDLFLEGFLDTF